MTVNIDTNSVRQILVEYAKNRKTIDYQSLSKDLGFTPPNTILQTTTLLEACQEDDALLELPQLVCVVIQRKGDKCPRPGFFQTLTKLGIYKGKDRGAQAQMWHQNELEKVFSYYATS